MTLATATLQRLSALSGDGNPQWVQLLPAGTSRGKDGRGPFRVEDPDAIIANSIKLAANTGGMLAVDYNHSTDLAAPDGKPSPAAGWVMRMENRNGEVWGLVEWTPTGLLAVRNREYRFLSPVIMHTPDGVVRSVARAAVTNDPNLTMAALNAAKKEATMETDTLLAELRTALGLQGTADGAAILEAVKKLLTDNNTTDPTKFVPFETFAATVAELNRVNSGISETAAKNAVEKEIENGTIMPFMRDWAVQLCTANKPAFDGFVARMAKPMKTLFASQLDGRSPFDDIGSGNDDDKEISRNLGLSADDVAKYGTKGKN